MFDASQPFADPARRVVSEYDPELHGWLDRPSAQPFEVSAATVAAGLGGLIAIGLVIAAAHETNRRS